MQVLRVCFFILCFGLLLPVVSSAQSSYKPGYVVTVKGDTMRGLIDYRAWDMNPSVIRFKNSAADKVTKLSVQDITYFSVNKLARYQRYIGPISLDNVSEDHMIEFRDTSYKIDAVFLEVLQQGRNATLYSYSDNNKTRFFISDKSDGKPVELVYRLYYDSEHVDYNANKGRTVYENTYMKQLFALAVKYNVVTDDLMKNLGNYGYKEYYLTQVVKMINGISK